MQHGRGGRIPPPVTMREGKRPRFLVVDSDGEWRRRLVDRFSVYGGALGVAEAKAAIAAVRASSGLVALVLDAVLADGCGFELLAAVRSLELSLPALVLTSLHDRESVNRADTLRAEFLCKPPDEECLTSFARRAVAYHWTRSRRLATIVDAMTLERHLTYRESELVAAALAGMPRRLVAEELGVSENTLKVQVRLLLTKCGMRSLDELADALLRRALGGSGVRLAAHDAAPNDKDAGKVS
jgi:FixJ family two-component response regulator